MGVDTSAAQAVPAPPLAPLDLASRLSPAPTRPPIYSVTIRNARGEDVVVGDPRATRALVALMDVHAVSGGAACHWGGPAAFAETLAALHAIMFATTGREWHEAFNFVNDAGHAENGIYALRANLGFDNLTFEDLERFRSITSKLTGHGESHLNPQGVLLSNGPLSSAAAQAQGLALADRVARRDRVTVCAISDGASMEGEAKEAFAAIPGLAARGRMNPFVLLLSDNDTKLSGRISRDAFAMQPTFEALSVLGWHVVRVPDGHDLEAVYRAIEGAIDRARRDPTAPVCVWLETIKGYGVKATMDDPAGGHGFPLSSGEKIVEFVDEIYGGQTPTALAEWARRLRKAWEEKDAARKSGAKPAAPAAVKREKIQAGLARAAIRAAQDGLPIYSISADVQGSTGMSAFQKAFPDRFVDVGVAEANMVSTGAGVSKAGFIPIVDTFGQFGVTKGNLPLTMAALSQAPVVAVFSHVGFQDAADGASHQATTYFAATSAIPHTVVIAPSCSDEAEALMFDALHRVGADRLAGRDGDSYIFFVGRENYPVRWVEKATYPWGAAQVLRSGTDVVLAACGPLLDKALGAADLLAASGIKAAVVNNPFVNRVDVATIGPLVSAAAGRLVTIEDHQVIAGMGAQLSHALSRAGVAHRVETLGMAGDFGQSAYKAEELYEQRGLTAARMADAARALVG